MKYKDTISLLVFIVAVAAVIATSFGIFSEAGLGSYTHESIRGETVEIYGKGIYQHMSAEVAPQGIAQDYVTLLPGVPMLLFALFWTRVGSIKGRYLLAGTLTYFLVTYLFYLVMGMYNMLFLGYTVLLGTSFFALSLLMISLDPTELYKYFNREAPTTFSGGFLIFNSIVIGLLWLSIIIPPLLEGTIIPPEVEHYTTLIVQGLDLALLLPLSFVSGYLLLKRKAFGYLLAPIYFVFLSLLMIALTAKIIAMELAGQNVIPAVLIVPTLALVAIICTVLLFNNINENYR